MEHTGCVAAVHHQWLYDELPLWAAARFLNACCNPFDAQSIKADLHQAAIVQANDGPLICKDTLCPFIAYFLWGATLGTSRYDIPAATHLFPHTFGTKQGDNDDGITVFDITEPYYPKYCFASIHGLANGGPQPKILTPLTAEEYLRCYYPAPGSDATPVRRDQDRVYQSYIDAFKHFGLVEINQRAEVWPHEYKVPPTDPIKVVDQDDATIPIQDPSVDVASLTQLSLEVLYDTAGEWPPAEHVLEIGGRALDGYFDLCSGIFDIGDKITLRTARSIVRIADFLITGYGRVGDLIHYLDMSRYRGDAALSAAEMQSISDAFPNLKCINLIGCNQITREVIDEHYTNNPSSPLLLNYADFSPEIDFLSLIQAPMRTPARFTVIARVRENYSSAAAVVIFGRPYLHIDAALASASGAVVRLRAGIRIIGSIIAWATSLYSGSEDEPGICDPSISFPARVISSESAYNTGWAFFLDAYATQEPKYAFVNLGIPTEDNATFTVDSFVEQTSSIVRKSLQPTANDIIDFKIALETAMPPITVMSVNEVESLRTAARQPKEPRDR